MRLGLPGGVRSCLFDLDGVLTETATVHAAAGDAFLEQWTGSRGQPFVPFDVHGDHDRYGDGKPCLAGVRDLLASRDTHVDGVVAEREDLQGKPDIYLAGARLLGVDPPRAAAFEDAPAGVESGRAGHFGCVAGVDRVGPAEAPKAHGADRDVSDLLDPGSRP